MKRTVLTLTSVVLFSTGMVGAVSAQSSNRPVCRYVGPLASATMGQSGVKCGPDGYYESTVGGYYDQYAIWHNYEPNNGYYYGADTGYYDNNGVWHYYGSLTPHGYYDTTGVWHYYRGGNPAGHYDTSGVWHPQS